MDAGLFDVKAIADTNDGDTRQPLAYEDGARLPDAVTIQYGPRDLMARLFLKADTEIRQRGIRLRVRHDFDALLDLNLEECRRGNWYRLPPMFDRRYVDVGMHNAFWLSGEDVNGDVVVTQAARVYDWRGTSLAEQARELFYEGQDHDLPCHVTVPGAEHVRGMVCYSGSTWFHPNYRRLGMSRMLPRISRTLAAATWGTDWTMSLVQRHLVDIGLARAYGYKSVDFSVLYPGSPWGDLNFALVRMNALEMLRDAEDFVAQRHIEEERQTA